MLAIIALSLIALVFVASLLFALKGVDSEVKKIGWVFAATSLFSFLVVLGVSSFFYVEARTLAIIVEFGKPVGTADSGGHWAAPWKTVYDFPTSSQPLDYDSTDGAGNPVQVKFNGGTTGTVHSNQNWSVQSDDKAIKLWENWRDFDKVTANVVDPTVRSITAKIVANYKPEEAVRGEIISKIEKEIVENVNRELDKNGIRIESLLIKKVDPDAQAQSRIDRQNALDADLKATDTEADIATKKADINSKLEKSLTPEILIDRCLTILENWDREKKGDFPDWQPCNGVLPALPVK